MSHIHISVNGAYKVICMNLTILGSAGSYGAPGIACSSYLVQDGTHHLLLDCGNGSFSLLSRVMDPHQLDAVFVSHRHHDHLADLVSLYHYLLFVPPRLPRRIPLLASAITHQALDSIFGLDLGLIFEQVTVDPKIKIDIGSMSLGFLETDHVPGTLAIRIENTNAKSLCFSADAGPSDDLADFCSGADLLLGEATWLQRPVSVGSGLHMTALELGQLAAKAKVDKLMVTHVAYPNDPQMSAYLAGVQFTGETIAAVDLMTIEI